MCCWIVNLTFHPDRAVLFVATVLCLNLWTQPVQAEGERNEAAVRVARETQAGSVRSNLSPVNPVPSPFNLTKQPNEHPLDPVVRVMQEVKTHIDANDCKLRLGCVMM